MDPYLLLRRNALAAGYTDDDLRRLRRRGELSTVARGAYVEVATALDAGARHRLQILACAERTRLDAAVSHQSAAIMHGLDLWSTPLDRVHVSRVAPARGHRSREMHCHVAAMVLEEIVIVDDLLVTDVARTVVDLARTLPFEQALVAADSALHLGLTTPDLLAAAARSVAGTPGSLRAARVTEFADGRSESVGESRSRVLIARIGLPKPDLQVEVRNAAGELIARTDFGWLHRRVVGEFDGRTKYERLLKPGQRPEDAVYAEKLREDAVRAEDLGVVRWTWPELDRPPTLGAKIVRSFEVADRRR